MGTVARAQDLRGWSKSPSSPHQLLAWAHGWLRGSADGGLEGKKQPQQSLSLLCPGAALGLGLPALVPGDTGEGEGVPVLLHMGPKNVVVSNLRTSREVPSVQVSSLWTQLDAVFQLRL